MASEPSSQFSSAASSDVFYLHDNGQLVLPYVPPAYLDVNASKICDGLFIGNREASQDFEFLITNKITHIINCTGHVVPNFLSKFGIRYLTYRWTEKKTTVMFDSKGQTLEEVCSFINSAISNSTGVLIHSVHGKSRACCVAAAYLMKSFGWGLQKALEFIQFKRPDINPRPLYLRQLRKLERMNLLNGPISAPGGVDDRWLADCSSVEELVARNTFLNGHYIKAESEVGNNFMVYDEVDDDTETGKDGYIERQKTQRITWSKNIVQPKGAQYSQHRPWRRTGESIVPILKRKSQFPEVASRCTQNKSEETVKEYVDYNNAGNEDEVEQEEQEEKPDHHIQLLLEPSRLKQTLHRDEDSHDLNIEPKEARLHDLYSNSIELDSLSPKIQKYEQTQSQEERSHPRVSYDILNFIGENSILSSTTPESIEQNEESGQHCRISSFEKGRRKADSVVKTSVAAAMDSVVALRKLSAGVRKAWAPTEPTTTGTIQDSTEGSSLTSIMGKSSGRLINLGSNIERSIGPDDDVNESVELRSGDYKSIYNRTTKERKSASCLQASPSSAMLSSFSQAWSAQCRRPISGKYRSRNARGSGGSGSYNTGSKLATAGTVSSLAKVARRQRRLEPSALSSVSAPLHSTRGSEASTRSSHSKHSSSRRRPKLRLSSSSIASSDAADEQKWLARLGHLSIAGSAAAGALPSTKLTAALPTGSGSRHRGAHNSRSSSKHTKRRSRSASFAPSR